MATTKQIVHYRYRVYSDAKVPDRISLDGVVLQKPQHEHDNWTLSPQQYHGLQKYVRSTSNPTGMVQYEEYDALTGELLFTPFPQEKRFPSYSREVLATFTRPELLKIARSYGVNTINMKEEALCKRILELQKQYEVEEPKVSTTLDAITEFVTKV